MMTTCETCGGGNVVGVASVPGIPYSAAYCRACLEANAHPWFILVGTTAACGGLEKMHDAWLEMVEDTCLRLGKMRAQFDADVKQVTEDLQGYGDDDL
jgi:hypothetical protein